MLEFLTWPIIGSGQERVCYRDPNDPLRCVKVSKKEQSKQTRRELSYYQYLASRDISYSHIPKFYKKVDEGEYIGLEMEFICNPDGSNAPDLYNYIKLSLSEKEVENLYHSLEKLRIYLIENNIVPCDLVLSNFLVQTLPDGVKIVMVDGLGGAEFIPLSNYIAYFGKRKINRKWGKFLDERVIPKIKKHKK
ncbi:YrbL family protein [Enterovibrio norvegicus]|uniref:Protein kinase domain-containing protein n=1 Tax=Enterovibrio norvegicus TaxID=188144 RepID=A0A2N7LEL7_9GAMM|nr:YrbL family protein [Enterovibrio norvegicus]PML79731.1 hypothetical protein BCT69_12650 [Enterovibrio norvegicus]PMN69833.1 hypothetical protein BCT27_19910 [Enterovibrio norvegicus]PMN93738.1 hypothetical protein BCT23_11910 [Enterovibrio norvegicus]